jgi:hypothetical protein
VRYNEDSKGEIHGKYISYRENGKVEFSGNYFHGVKQGNWLENYYSGEVLFFKYFSWYEKGNHIFTNEKPISSYEEAIKLSNEQKIKERQFEEAETLKKEQERQNAVKENMFQNNPCDFARYFPSDSRVNEATKKCTDEKTLLEAQKRGQEEEKKKYELRREREKPDDDAFNRATQLSTIKAYNDYLKQFVEGKHVIEIKNLLKISNDS